MAQTFQDGEGFTYSQTELSNHVIPGKDACPDSIAVADLDGDGWGDLIAIESPGFDMQVQELVGVHVPSGRVVWRALRGQCAGKLALAEGVVVVAVNGRTGLAGVEARSGQVLWTQPLPAALSDDPYDNTWNAPALTVHGPWVAFETEDGQAHAIEARTGRVVVSRKGRLAEHGHDVPGLLVFFEDGDGRTVTLFDLARGRPIHSGKTHAFAPIALGTDGSFALFHAESLPNGVPMTRAVVFDQATMERRATAWVVPDEDSNVLRHDGAYQNMHRAALLPGGRLLVGSRDDDLPGVIVVNVAGAPPPKQEEKKGFFGKLFGGGDAPPPKPQGVRPAGKIAPPEPDCEIRLVESFGPVVVTIWEREDSKKLVVMGFDAQTLQPRWRIPDCGGTNLMNQGFRTPFGLLVPFSPAGREEYKRQNPVAWWHVDPMTGQKLAEYAVPDLDCVRVTGKYLVGFVSSFTSSYPVAWDLEKRQRVI